MSKFRASIPPTLKAALRGSPFVGRGTAYKFHHSRHTESILENGTIKIGRLSDYRSIEKDSLRDEHEGVEWTGFDAPTRMSDIDPRSGVHKAFVVGANAPNVILDGLSVIVHHEDLYVFCFSYKCSSKIIKSFDDEVPYDAVAICNNIFNVADIICEHHPMLRGSRYLCLPMLYRNRMHLVSEPYVSPLEQAFEKPLRFFDNVEGRILLIPPPNLQGRPMLPLWSHPSIAKCFKSGVLPIEE